MCDENEGWKLWFVVEFYYRNQNAFFLVCLYHDWTLCDRIAVKDISFQSRFQMYDENAKLKVAFVMGNKYCNQNAF